MPEALKTCPDCAEEVKEAANVCRFCGYRFDVEAARREEAEEGAPRGDPRGDDTLGAYATFGPLGLVWVALMRRSPRFRRWVEAHYRGSLEARPPGTSSWSWRRLPEDERAVRDG
jgi:hypothetical protein